MFMGSKAHPVRTADSLAAMFEQMRISPDKISSNSGYTLTGDLPLTNTFSQNKLGITLTKMYWLPSTSNNPLIYKNNIETNLASRNITLWYGFHIQQS
jgi:hypothetical protein